jgi:hypothetical protein
MLVRSEDVTIEKIELFSIVGLISLPWIIIIFISITGGKITIEFGKRNDK